MKKEIVVELVLIGTLIFFGNIQVRDIKAASKARIDIANSLIDANRRATFRSISAVDFNGRLVSPVLVPDAQNRLVVFVIRASTFESDINYWTSVSNILAAKQFHAHLVGYCDSDACVNEARNRQQPINFSMAVYGEVISSQALLNADAQGNFFLIDKSVHPLAWRGSDKTPAAVARAILE